MGRPAFQNSPWSWVLSVYFLQGFPYTLVTVVTEILFQQQGLHNEQTTFYSSLLALPWMIKFLWGPLLECFGSKRAWIIYMQLLMGLCCLGMIFSSSIPLSGHFIAISMMNLMLFALFSATHDFNSDGYYILTLNQSRQAYFVGWRSGAYMAGRFMAQGGLIFLVGV